MEAPMYRIIKGLYGSFWIHPKRPQHTIIHIKEAPKVAPLILGNLHVSKNRTAFEQAIGFTIV